MRPAGAVVAALLCAGCGGDYTISVRNGTDDLIRDAAVVYGDFRSVTGSLPPGVTKSHAFVSAPLPEGATVEWRTPDEVLHSKEVAVGAILPRGFSGEIHFEIGPGERVDVRAGP